MLGSGLIRFVSVSFLALVLALPSRADAQIPLESPLPVDPNVTIGELDNGVKYIIRQNSRPENRAELRLVVDVGSVLEDDSQLGLAHFVEHMAFNGTERFEEPELVRTLESFGMEFGPGVNTLLTPGQHKFEPCGS